MRIAQHLTEDQRALAMQFIRYGITGGFVTFAGAAVYWWLATPMRFDPQVAINLAYMVSMVLGYFLHGRYSFKGHGSSGTRSVAQSVRFVLVSFVSLGLNKIWVWLFTDYLGGPPWWAIPAICFVTPVAVFTLNRKWVFA